MRRLLAAVIASGAIAALAGPLSSSAGAAYRGTFFTYPYVQAVSGPEWVGPLAVGDGNAMGGWVNCLSPENNPWMTPCAYHEPKDVCVTVVNEYWQQEIPWACGGESASTYAGVYGWPVVGSYVAYSAAAIFMLDNWG
jgi:hypothetical protein